MRIEKGPARTQLEKASLLAGLALVLLLAAVSCGSATERVAPEEAQASVDLGPPSMGEENAPVVLIEYSDLQ